jgi:dihydroorotate dehydrogenase (fumarate)
MADLHTTYLGIPLKNPIIVGACNLVSNTDNLKRMEDAGAAAIVYKSLFEEQIQLERLELDESITEYDDRHAEMTTLFPDIEHAGPSEHLMNLRLAKESVGIPVIASLNCAINDTWIEYAKSLEDTGVDALELNFYYVPRDLQIAGQEIIAQQIQVLKTVKEKVKIPVSIKLSPFYANPLHVIKQMDGEGSNGFVLFNRFLQPDIDIDNISHTNHFSLSNPEENKLPLRFAGLLFDNISASICVNSGIYSAGDIIKMLIELNQWMDNKNFKKIKDFKGLLSQKKVNDPFIYKRAQYIDILQKSGDIFKKYKLH